MFSQGGGTLSAENPVARRKQQEGKTQDIILQPVLLIPVTVLSVANDGPPNSSGLKLKKKKELLDLNPKHSCIHGLR